VLFLFILIADAQARPISYPEGWTLMGQSNWEKNRIHLHYSPTSSYSLGVVSEDFKNSNRKDFGFQLNNLLFRKNTSKSQTNVYSMIGLGLAKEDSYELNKTLRFSGDWETRRYFTSYNFSLRHADSIDDGSFHQEGRVGVAPYLAEFGSIHTWLMLQAQHHPEEAQEVRIAPIIRLFKDQFLFELGLDSEKDFIFNFIYRH